MTVDKGTYTVIEIVNNSIQLKKKNGNTLLNNTKNRVITNTLMINNFLLGMHQELIVDKMYVIGNKYNTSELYTNDKINVGIVSYLENEVTYNNLLKDARQWFKFLKNNFTKLDETSDILQINMKNSSDSPWHTVKKEIAYRRKELTLLWNVTTENKKQANENGIYKYTDPGCNSEIFGINGKKSEILDKMIMINSNKKKIIPNKIVNNYNNWRKKSKIEIFIDLEFIMSVPELNLDKPFITMIGLYIVINKKKEYKCFYLEKVNKKCEKTLLKEFVSYIKMLETSYNSKAIFYHWSNAEPCYIGKALTQYGLEKKEFKWVDLMKVFMQEPIVMRGVFDFKLKSITNKLSECGYISNNYCNLECQDGLSALYLMYKYYNISYEEASIEEKKTIKSDLIKYNKMDCEVLKDILYFIRTK